MNKPNKDNHDLMNWTIDDPNSEFYNFTITKYNSVEFGIGRYAQGAVGGSCTYKEFLNGKCHDFVREHFGQSTLNEAIKVVRQQSLAEHEISEKIIGAAEEVHRILGPGLLKLIYEEAVWHELHLRGIRFVRQQVVPIHYKEIKLNTDLTLDLLVEGAVIVDIKAIENVPEIDQAKLLTCLRLSNKKLGLIINFHVTNLTSGIKRLFNDLPK